MEDKIAAKYCYDTKLCVLMNAAEKKLQNGKNKNPERISHEIF